MDPKDVRLEPELEDLRQVLDQWIELTGVYCRETHRPTYPNLERTETGVFAAAVWNKGGVALEELSCQRRARHGRPDLWFRFGDSNYMVEAKLHEIVGRQLANAATVTQKLEAALEEAECQVEDWREHHNVKALALAFATCWLPVSQKDAADRVRDSAVTGLQDVRGQLHAYVFPQVCLEHAMRQPRWSADDQYYRYGSMVAGRVVLQRNERRP